MKYNYETSRQRYNSGSKKWDEMKKMFPNIDVTDDIVPFSTADMEFDNAPQIKEGLKKYIDDMVLGYANPTDQFYANVISWMKRRHNWDIDPEWIVNTHGVVSAFFISVCAFTKPGEGVMLLTPSYYPMYASISHNERVLVDSPLINNNGHYEIDFEDFEKKAKDPNTKLFILCSPHNPTSRVWTPDELSRLGRICIDNGVMICSDEIHFDLIMPGYTHTVFAGISDEFANNCIVCTAPSKTFNLAGMDTSNIIIPNKQIRDQFNNEQRRHGQRVDRCNMFGYEANRIAYEECEDWLDGVIEVVDRNRQLVENFMAKEFPEIVVTRMEGTYLLWFDMSKLGLENDQINYDMRHKAKLFFDNGDLFGKQGECCQRWNLATPTKYIEDGLQRFKETFKK